jgi:hypothetical protein
MWQFPAYLGINLFPHVTTLLLQEPKTQIEIIAYAKQGCQMLGDPWAAQCVQYVDMYGALVINMAEAYLQPDQLCAKLGYCPAPGVASA